MEKFKLYDEVRAIKDKDFICPVERVKKGAEGTIVLICEKKGKIGYLVEINNEVYDFKDDEIEVIGQKS
jgi:hypothetical protein